MTGSSRSTRPRRFARSRQVSERSSAASFVVCRSRPRHATRRNSCRMSRLSMGLWHNPKFQFIFSFDAITSRRERGDRRASSRDTASRAAPRGGGGGICRCLRPEGVVWREGRSEDDSRRAGGWRCGFALGACPPDRGVPRRGAAGGRG